MLFFVCGMLKMILLIWHRMVTYKVPKDDSIFVKEQILVFKYGGYWSQKWEMWTKKKVLYYQQY
jgi:hypothetical protein